jgi:Ala-tRNA(Pro) deacylase
MDLFEFLAEHHITFERQDHPAVYTVEQARRLVPSLPGAKTKNLFLRDKKGQRHFLVVIGAEKRVNLKQLQALLRASKLSLGSPERLKQYLGIEPGAVSLFAIFNDPNHAVEVIIDRSLWSSPVFQFHPLVNTSTLVISKENLERFLALTGQTVQILDLPG